LDKKTDEELVKETLVTLTSMSTLYETMELAMLERAYGHMPGSNLSSTHYKALRQQLAAIAFESFNHEQLIIPAQRLNDVLTHIGVGLSEFAIHIKALTELGLLKPVVGENGSEASNTKGYEFLHLTFQEYYAGRYLLWQFEQGLTEDEAAHILMPL